MPQYQISVPGQGTFLVESPTELTDAQAWQAVQSQLSAVPAQPAQGALVSGFKSYVPSLQETYGGLKTLLGVGTERVIGEGAISKGLIESGAASMAEAEKARAPLMTKERGSFTDALDKGVGSVLTEWLPFQAGAGAAQVLEALALVGAGGLAGTATAPGPGTIVGAGTGLVARELAKRGVKEAAEKILKERGEDAAKVYFEKAAKDVALEIGKKRGQTAALAGQAAFYGTGQTTSRAVEEAEKLGGTATDIELARVLPASAVATVAEFLGDKIALGALKGIKPGEPGKFVAADLAKNILLNIGLTGTKEVPVEVIQSAAERFGAKLSLTDAQALKEYIDSTAASYGMAVGPGGAGGVRQTMAERANKPAVAPAPKAPAPEAPPVAPPPIAPDAGLEQLTPQQKQELERQRALTQRPKTTEELLAETAIQTGRPTTAQDIFRIRDEHETAVIEGLLAQDAEMARANELARRQLELESEAEATAGGISDVDARVREGRIFARVQDLIDRNIPFASTAINEINQKFGVINEAPLNEEERARIENIMGMVNTFTNFVNLPVLAPKPVDQFAENQAMEALIKERTERGQAEPLRAAPPAPSPRIEEAPVSQGVGEGATLRPTGGVEPSVAEDRERVAPTPPTKPTAFESQIVSRQPAPDGMEVHVFATTDGYGTGLFDADAGQYVNGSVTRFAGADTLPKAEARAAEMLRKATPAAPAEPSVEPLGTRKEAQAFGKAIGATQPYPGELRGRVNLPAQKAAKEGNFQGVLSALEKSKNVIVAEIAKRARALGTKIVIDDDAEETYTGPSTLMRQMSIDGAKMHLEALNKIRALAPQVDALPDKAELSYAIRGETINAIDGGESAGRMYLEDIAKMGHSMFAPLPIGESKFKTKEDFKRLQKAYEDLTSEYGENALQLTSTGSAQITGVAGVYDAATDTIRVPEYTAKREEVLSHEIVHAQTVQAIANPTLRQKPIVARLNKLYEHVKKELEVRPGFSNSLRRAPYGIQSIQEFVAEGMGNPAFQFLLKKIKYENTSAWDSFVQTIANLIGVKRDTAFTELLSIYSELTTEQKAAPKAPAVEAPTPKAAATGEPAVETALPKAEAPAAPAAPKQPAFVYRTVKGDQTQMRMFTEDETIEFNNISGQPQLVIRGKNIAGTEDDVVVVYHNNIDRRSNVYDAKDLQKLLDVDSRVVKAIQKWLASDASTITSNGQELAKTLSDFVEGSAAETPAAPKTEAPAAPTPFMQLLQEYWGGTVTPAIKNYLDAFNSFGVDRLESSQIKPAGMTAREWIESFVSKQSTWDKGRKTGVTGIQALSTKNLWPTADGSGERLRKSMLEAVKALKNAPGSTSELMDQAFTEERKSLGKEQTKQLQDFQQTLRNLLNKFGLKDVGLNIEEGMRDAGSYSQQLIRIAADEANPIRTLRHEAIHALRELGFFTDAQWNSLSKMAKDKWIDQYLKQRNEQGRPLKAGEESRYDAYMREYNGDMEKITEEAVADAFADFDATKPPAGMLQALLKRMKDLFQSIKSALTKIESPEQIFGKVEKGELRAGTREARGEAKSLRDRATANFLRWFGNSKVVDMNGKPLVVYHGSKSDITEFDPSRGAAGNQGMFFTTDIDLANVYGKDGAVYPVYVSIKNPLILQGNERFAPQGIKGKLAKLLFPTQYKKAEREQRVKDMLFDGNAGRIFSKQDVELLRREGYDGVVTMNAYPEGSNLQVIVAFDPVQIKSAIGNNGDYSLTNADIRKSLGKVTAAAQKALQKQPMPEKGLSHVSQELTNLAQPIFFPQNKTILDRIDSMKDRFWQRLAQGTADQFRTIKEYSPLGYMQARLSKSIDGSLEGLLFHGHVFDDGGALNIKKNTKGMMEILKPIGTELDSYLMWVALNRESRLPENKRSKIPNMDKLVARRAEFAAGELNGKPRVEVYQDVLRQMNQLNKSVLDIALAKGLIDQNGYDKFSNDIYYIPFYKKMEEDGTIEGAQTASGLTSQYFSKELKGGEAPFGDLMENIVRNWSHILSASMKNAAAQTTVKDAMELQAAEPNLKAGLEWKDGKVYSTKNDKPIEAKFDEDGKQIYAEGELRPDLTTNAAGMAKIMVDGQPMYFKITDDLLMESISSIGYMGPKSKFLDVMRDFKNMLQFGVTASPIFKVNNLIRDSVSALAVSDLKKSPVYNVMTGISLSKKDSPTYISALAGGAIFNFGSAYEGDQAKLIKRLLDQGVDDGTILDSPDKIKKALKKTWDAYQELGNRSEAANRLSLYQQLRDKGLSHLEASFMARDLLDFSMQGSWGTFRFLTQVVPFMNARIQGLYKLGRDGINPTVRVLYNATTGKEINANDKIRAAQFATVTSAVMLASALLYLTFKDDEDYKKRDAWDRDNFWWFKIPSLDIAFRIPKPFEVGAFGTLVERSLEQILDEGAEGKQFGESLNRTLWDTFALNPMPQIFKPLSDIYANKDSFSGAPIESAGLERLSKPERMTDMTSPLGIAMSKLWSTIMPEKFEASPVQMDYAIKGYFGWLGAMASMASTYAVMPFKEGEYPDARWLDRASLGLVRDLPAPQSAYVTAFYNSSKEISQAYADMRHYREMGDAEKVQELLEEKGDKIMLAKFYDKTAKNIANVRKQIQLITNDKNLDGAEKKEMIERMKLIMSDLAKQAEEVRKSMKP